MKLFKCSNTPKTLTAQPVQNDIQSVSEQGLVFHRITLALLHFLKAFAYDAPEIEGDSYKETIEQLKEHFNSSEKPSKQQELFFEHKRDDIIKFIDSQKAYLDDRDKELRDIIELLTKAMANLNVENRDFYQHVYDESEKIIEITRLDDIKKIKNALKQEVDQMRGVIDIKREQENHQMQLLADQVDVLRNELAKAKEKSLTDPLTGVYNRLAFDEYINEMVDRFAVSKESFSILMLDLDDFKSINDKHGHPVGDRVLMAFSQKCRTTIRSDDFLARYGGEEFVIILPGANLANALKKARYICQTIASVCYAVSTTTTDDHLSITVSIGVATMKKDDTVESLIARVDKALYEAKRNGKNGAVSRK